HIFAQALAQAFARAPAARRQPLHSPRRWTAHSLLTTTPQVAVARPSAFHRWAQDAVRVAKATQLFRPVPPRALRESIGGSDQSPLPGPPVRGDFPVATARPGQNSSWRCHLPAPRVDPWPTRAHPTATIAPPVWSALLVQRRRFPGWAQPPALPGFYRHLLHLPQLPSLESGLAKAALVPAQSPLPHPHSQVAHRGQTKTPGSTRPIPTPGQKPSGSIAKGIFRRAQNGIPLATPPDLPAVVGPFGAMTNRAACH